jgi:hypothetical protein
VQESRGENARTWRLPNECAALPLRPPNAVDDDDNTLAAGDASTSYLQARLSHQRRGQRCAAAHMSVLKLDFLAGARAGTSTLPLGVSSLSADAGTRACSLRRMWLEEGAVEEGAVEGGAVEEGAVEEGAVEEGAVAEGASLSAVSSSSMDKKARLTGAIFPCSNRLRSACTVLEVSGCELTRGSSEMQRVRQHSSGSSSSNSSNRR